MAFEPTAIKAVSASVTPAPGIKNVPEVIKLIDVSSCIGCKACEEACQEWNDLSANVNRPFLGSYQTLPDLDWNFWQLIKFNEVQRDGRFIWTMTKYQCMHCGDPGMPAGLPRPRRHRPVRQRHRRLRPGELHRLRLLHNRLSV